MAIPRLVSAAVLLVALVWIGSALATGPGTNGRIAFRRFLDAKQSHGAVFVIAPDGSGEQRITSPPPRTVDDQPDWSPDGQRLVFSRCANSCRIWMVNADGSGLRPLTRACTKRPRPDRIPSGCEDDANATFTPDGTHVTFTRATGRIRHFPKLHTDQIEHSAIAIIGADGSGEREILRTPPYDSDANFPQLSPDGQTIVFGRGFSPVGHPRRAFAIYTVSADGSGMRRITPLKLHAGDGPDWAPDGSRILFRSNEDIGDNAKSQVYSVRPDGSDLRQLTHVAPGTLVFSSTWSPDGTRIVFSMAPKGHLPDVYTMAPDGSDVQQVTHSPKWDSAPDWGPQS